MVKKKILGFIEFLRSQGVVGLAIGFILGQGAKDVVTSFVDDILGPLLGLIIGSKEGLESATFLVYGATVSYGNFLKLLMDFVIVAGIVYFVFKGFKLDRLDLKKDSQA